MFSLDVIRPGARRHFTHLRHLEPRILSLYHDGFQITMDSVFLSEKLSGLWIVGYVLGKVMETKTVQLVRPFAHNMGIGIDKNSWQNMPQGL